MCIVIIIIIFIIFTLQYISKKSSWFLNHKWKDCIYIYSKYVPSACYHGWAKHYKALQTLMCSLGVSN